MMKRLAISFLFVAAVMQACTKGGELIPLEVNNTVYSVSGNGDSKQMVPEILKPITVTSKFSGMYVAETNTFDFTLEWQNLYNTVKDTITAVKFYGPAIAEYLGDPMQSVPLTSSSESGSLNYSLSGFQSLLKSSKEHLISGKLYYVLCTSKYPQGILRGQLSVAPGDYSQSKVSGINFTETVVVMKVGDKANLSSMVSIQPMYASNKKLAWETDKPEAATVDQMGNVIALKSEIVTITAKATDGSNISAAIKLSIDYTPVSSIEIIEKTPGLLKSGGKFTFSAPLVLPVNANNKNVTWSSTNTAVATVDQSGVITAVAGGQANIVATAADGFGATSTVAISVINDIPTYRIQSENFSDGNVGKETNVAYSNGQGIGSIRNNYYTIYGNNKIKLRNYTFIDISAGCNNTGIVTVEVRENSTTGNLLSTLTLNKTSGSLVFATTTALINKSAVTNLDADVSLCLVYKGPNTWMCNADWIDLK